jgi:hypothetical protein
MNIPLPPWHKFVLHSRCRATRHISDPSTDDGAERLPASWGFQMRGVCCLLAVAATSALAAPDPGVDPGVRALFIGEHRCEIADRLETIHRRGPVTISRDRFVAVALHAQPQR